LNVIAWNSIDCSACKFTFVPQIGKSVRRDFLFTEDPNIVPPSNTNVISDDGGSGYRRSGGGSAPVWNCPAWGECPSSGTQERTCLQGSTSRKETQSCVYVYPEEPKPVEVPVEEPVPVEL